jgi:U3 small nucleolar RNA-associated protein 12
VEPAHSGPVWSLALLPDKSGFISGSADKTVKFWTWAVVEKAAEPAGKGKKKKSKNEGEGEEDGEGAGSDGGGGGGGARQLSVVLTQQLEMAEDVLCVRASPDGRLVAVALLDATIKVYYLDRCGGRGFNNLWLGWSVV